LKRLKKLKSEDIILRKRIFEVIEVSKGGDSLSNLYDYAMIVVIVISLVPLMFKEATPTLIALDLLTAAVFVVDYILRLITADLKFGKKSVWSFLRYPFSPHAVIDILSIMPSFILLNGGFRLLRISRMMRAFRVFRALKSLRYSKSMNVLLFVLKKQRSALMAVATLAVGYILLAALVIFNIEPESFDNFFNAVYWATVSLTTMGYGDIYPITATGQIVTIFSALIGVAIVALPAGIITAGYIEALRNEAKHENQTEETD
jgi:voltage-gated potassium channel